MNDAILRAACEVRDAMLSSLPRECPHYEASPRFEKRMERLLADPVGYAKKMLRPWYQSAAQGAAMLAAALGLSALLLSQLNPTAWAAVKQWFMEIRQTDIVYYFTGEAAGKELPYYTMTDLPEGYVYTEEKNDNGYRSIRYTNDNHEKIILDYAIMMDGSAFVVDTENMTVQNVTINGCHGQIFVSTDGKQNNAVIWIDEAKNLQFFIDAPANDSDLLHIAESVSLVKTENP